MRILYVDTISEPHAQMNVRGILKAYRRKGFTVTFDYRRIARLLGESRMNALLVMLARIVKPDLIHLGKCESVRSDAIRDIKTHIKCAIVHYFGDFRRTVQPYVADIGKYADATLLCHRDEAICRAHRDAGLAFVGYWRAGADTGIYHPRAMPRRYDIVFMANNSGDIQEKSGQGYKERLRLIDGISQAGFKMHLFGRGWESLKGMRGIVLNGYAGPEMFARACSRAKITLGHNTADVYGYTSWRRPLNSMACGAFHLIRYFPGLEEVFENGRHLVWYHTIEEALELARYYLEHDDRREAIAAYGREEVTRAHTWDCRISEIMALYQRLRGNV